MKITKRTINKMTTAQLESLINKAEQQGRGTHPVINEAKLVIEGREWAARKQ